MAASSLRARQVANSLADAEQIENELSVALEAKVHHVNNLVAQEDRDQAAILQGLQEIQSLTTSFQAARASRLQLSTNLRRIVGGQPGVQPDPENVTLNVHVTGSAAKASALKEGASVHVKGGGSLTMDGEPVVTWGQLQAEFQSFQNAIETAAEAARRQLTDMQLINQSAQVILDRAEALTTSSAEILATSQAHEWNTDTKAAVDRLLTEFSRTRDKLAAVTNVVELLRADVTAATARIMENTDILNDVREAVDVAFHDQYAMRSALALPQLTDLELLNQRLDGIERLEEVLTQTWPDVGTVEPQLMDALDEVLGAWLPRALHVVLHTYVAPLLGLDGSQFVASERRVASAFEALNLQSLRDRSISDPEVNWSGMAKSLVSLVLERVAELVKGVVPAEHRNQFVEWSLAPSTTIKLLGSYTRMEFPGGTTPSWQDARVELSLPVMNAFTDDTLRHSVLQALQQSSLSQVHLGPRTAEDMTFLQVNSTDAEANGRPVQGLQPVVQSLSDSTAARVGNISLFDIGGSQTKVAGLGIATYIMLPRQGGTLWYTTTGLLRQAVDAFRGLRISVAQRVVGSGNTSQSKHHGLVLLLNPQARAAGLQDVAWTLSTHPNNEYDLEALLQAWNEGQEPAGWTMRKSTAFGDPSVLVGPAVYRFHSLNTIFGRLSSSFPSFAVFVATAVDGVDNWEFMTSLEPYRLSGSGPPSLSWVPPVRLALDPGTSGSLHTCNGNKVNEVCSRGINSIILDLSRASGSLEDIVTIAFDVSGDAHVQGEKGGVLASVDTERQELVLDCIRNGYQARLLLNGEAHRVQQGGPGSLPFARWDAVNTASGSLAAFLLDSVWEGPDASNNLVAGMTGTIAGRLVTSFGTPPGGSPAGTPPVRSIGYIVERNGNVGIRSPPAGELVKNDNLWMLNVLDRDNGPLKVDKAPPGTRDMLAALESRASSAATLMAISELPHIAFKTGFDVVRKALSFIRSEREELQLKTARTRCVTRLDLESIVGLRMAPAESLTTAAFAANEEAVPRLGGHTLAHLLDQMVDGHYWGSTELHAVFEVSLFKNFQTIENVHTGLYCVSGPFQELHLYPSSDPRTMYTNLNRMSGLVLSIKPLVDAFQQDDVSNLKVRFRFSIHASPMEPGRQPLSNQVICQDVSQSQTHDLIEPKLPYFPFNYTLPPAVARISVSDSSFQQTIDFTSRAQAMNATLVALEQALGLRPGDNST